MKRRNKLDFTLGEIVWVGPDTPGGRDWFVGIITGAKLVRGELLWKVSTKLTGSPEVVQYSDLHKTKLTGADVKIKWGFNHLKAWSDVRKREWSAFMKGVMQNVPRDARGRWLPE